MILEVLLAVLGFIFLLFASALLFGAPFLPTLNKQLADAIKLLDLKPGQTMFDLGSGDGRSLKAAARLGIRAQGYEINPLLIIISMFRCLKERHLVVVHWANFWRAPLDEADGIYVFLLKPYMAKLDKKITQEITKPIKVVSFAFAFPDRLPAKQSNGLMLYEFEPRKVSAR